MSQAGPSVRFGPAGYWIAALPEEEREAILEEEDDQIPHWDATYGDRMTKVVFIGIEMDRVDITASLDACLLTDDEMLIDWRQFEDQLPNAMMEFEDA